MKRVNKALQEMKYIVSHPEKYDSILVQIAMEDIKLGPKEEVSARRRLGMLRGHPKDDGKNHKLSDYRETCDNLESK